MQRMALSLVLMFGMFLGTAAEAQNFRLRGTIVAVEGDTLSVRSREGETLRLQMADNLSVAVAVAVRFEDIKQGDYVGATTKKQPDGSMVAIEVHYLAPTVAEGQGPWDLEPDSTMTNAKVAAVVAATGRRELTLQFKDTSQRILVPDAAALARTVPGARSDLKIGEYIFAGVQKSADGKLTVARIQVSKDGVRPPL
jgi:hypothetical protein